MTLEDSLGYFFFDKHHLRRSLTRRAYALEQPQPCDDQEAYSLLGGAVLDAVLTELLIRAGQATQAAIVMQKLELKQVGNLAQISHKVGVGYVVKLGQVEKTQKLYDDPLILAESLEAIIGGIYFDGGYSAARRVIQRLFNLFPAD